LNPGPPALEASTIPLGYRGGSIVSINSLNSELVSMLVPCYSKIPQNIVCLVQVLCKTRLHILRYIFLQLCLLHLNCAVWL